jgi:hypothetical protein
LLPPDVVLLFETDGEWNQTGKVELRIFENKNPKGYMKLVSVQADLDKSRSRLINDGAGIPLK